MQIKLLGLLFFFVTIRYIYSPAKMTIDLKIIFVFNFSNNHHILFLSVAMGCLPTWANTCKNSSDCCSSNCDNNNGLWEYGVCKPLNTKRVRSLQTNLNDDKIKYINFLAKRPLILKTFYFLIFSNNHHILFFKRGDGLSTNLGQHVY